MPADPATDAKRMTRAIGRVFETLRDEQWHDLQALATATGDTPKRVASRIRDLRLANYGNYTIEKQVVNKTTQLWKYRLILNGKQITPLANTPVAAKAIVPQTPAKPVISAPTGVTVVPGKHTSQFNGAIKFFNTNTWKSELIQKKDCREEPDGPHKRIVAIDATGNPIPHLVTTVSAL